ncbi:MAG: DinB family protein [Caldilineaceae bacterium]
MATSAEVTTLLELFDNKFGGIEELLLDLPAEALLWKPFEQSPWQGPSAELGRILAHALSSTVYLLRRAEYTAERIEWDQVEGDEGSEEFGPANLDPDYMRARILRVKAYVHATLPEFDDAALSATRPHPRRPQRIMSARWDVIHALEHMAEHIGHAQLTRQLWALQTA